MSKPTISTDLIASSLQGWRLLGSSVWYCAGSVASLWIWTLIRHPSLWVLPWRLLAVTIRPITLACLTGASLPFCLAALSLQPVLHVHEPQPNYALRFRVKAPLGVTVALARLAGRLTTAPAITSAALCTALHALTGWLFAVFDTRLSLGHLPSSTSGVCACPMMCRHVLHRARVLGWTCWQLCPGICALDDAQQPGHPRVSGAAAAPLLSTEASRCNQYACVVH